MKNLKYIGIFLSILTSLFMSSCETTEVTEVIEAEPNILFERQLSFTSANDYSVIVDFPQDFEIRDTDLVIAYRRNGVDESNNNAGIWDALPRTYFGPLGDVTYSFNYSVGGIQVLLDAEDGLDREALGDDFRINQDFQFAILPSELRSGKILNQDFSFNSISKNAIITP